MTSRDFAFWLQGFFEINEATGNDHEGLTIDQTEMIRRHLNLVFKHEIEPSMNLNDDEKKVHDGNLIPGKDTSGGWTWPPYSPWPNAPYVPGDGTYIPSNPGIWPQIYC